MNSAAAKTSILLSMLLVLLSTAGCAQVAYKVDVLYSPLTTYRGGTGNLDLVAKKGQRTSSNDPRIASLEILPL